MIFGKNLLLRSAEGFGVRGLNSERVKQKNVRRTGTSNGRERVKEILPKYAWILCIGHNQLLASKVKVKVKQKVKFT